MKKININQNKLCILKSHLHLVTFDCVYKICLHKCLLYWAGGYKQNLCVIY